LIGGQVSDVVGGGLICNHNYLLSGMCVVSDMKSKQVLAR
jgi:hypothetical protein